MEILTIVLLSVNIILVLFLIYFFYKNKQNDFNLESSLSEFAKSQRLDLSNLRQELTNLFLKLGQRQSTDIKAISELQTKHLNQIFQSVDKLVEKTDRQLDKIRETVDERLTTTLNKRLAEQFKLISERLEQVYHQLGQMQELNQGVGDLKKILSGVKTRGVWGEIQLEGILSQYFSKSQYDKNVRLGEKTRENVEFALKLPKDNNLKEVVYLPIDSKFPLEPYHRLIKSVESADKKLIEKAEKEFIASIVNEAKRIAKYVNPPKTTNFAIMYLPAEGIYAEVAQRPGLLEKLHKQHNIMVAGPSTITAFLLSIHMGLRTIAIQHHTSKVWEILAKIKHDFVKFRDMLAKTSRNLELTRKNIDEAIKRSEKISVTLDSVENLPELDSPLKTPNTVLPNMQDK